MSSVGEINYKPQFDESATINVRKFLPVRGPCNELHNLDFETQNDLHILRARIVTSLEWENGITSPPFTKI